MNNGEKFPLPVESKKKFIGIILIIILASAVVAEVSFIYWQYSRINSLEQELEMTEMKYSSKIDPLTKSKENSLLNESYKLLNNTCSESECLFESYNPNTKDFAEGWPIGIVKVKGYYKKDLEQKMLLPIGCEGVDVSIGCVEYEAEKCDRFVVTDGYEKMTPSFGRGGDSVIKINLDKLDETEEKIIGKGYSQISEKDKDVIIKSNEDKEIQLVLLAFKPELTVDANYCYSGVHILKVIE